MPGKVGEAILSLSLPLSSRVTKPRKLLEDENAKFSTDNHVHVNAFSQAFRTVTGYAFRTTTLEAVSGQFARLQVSEKTPRKRGRLEQVDDDVVPSPKRIDAAVVEEIAIISPAAMDGVVQEAISTTEVGSKEIGVLEDDEDSDLDDTKVSIGSIASSSSSGSNGSYVRSSSSSGASARNYYK
eukprot:scaffold1333_cov326-Ochromonas_danica.AAC.5